MLISNILTAICKCLSLTIVILLMVDLLQNSYSDTECIDLVSSASDARTYGIGRLNDTTTQVIIWTFAVYLLISLTACTSLCDPDCMVYATREETEYTYFIAFRIELFMMTIATLAISPNKSYSNFHWDCEIAENICPSKLCIHNMESFSCVTQIINNCPDVNAPLIEIAKSISLPVIIFYSIETIATIVFNILNNRKHRKYQVLDGGGDGDAGPVEVELNVEMPPQIPQNPQE